MKTSYFFSRKITVNDDLVSIAGSTPPMIRQKFSENLRCYRPLKPPRNLVMDYKSGFISQYEYTREYNNQLFMLDPIQVYDDLKDCIILCWEVPGKFCHRQLVAKWIYEKIGVEVIEL